MPRLFTAIEIPAPLRERLALLKSPLPGARWVERDNLHVTLRFAGDIDNPTAREFADNLAAIASDGFELKISGLGAFGGNDPRVIWAGIEDAPEIEALARANERAARAAGLPPESRAFKAHVTLARLKHSRVDAVARFLEHNARFALPPFHVDRFVLMSSRPQVGGGPYVVEDAFMLGGLPDWDDVDAGTAW